MNKAYLKMVYYPMSELHWINRLSINLSLTLIYKSVEFVEIDKSDYM